MAVSQTSCEPMFINGEWTEGSSGKRIPVYDPSTEEVIAEIPDASAADVDAAVSAARHAFDEGKLTGLEFWEKFLREAGLNSSPGTVNEVNHLDAQMWTTQNPVMLDWQLKLKQSGILTAILSNMGDNVLANMKREFDWLPRFDVLVWSFQLRMAKPDPAIYHHVLNELGTRPEETLFLDDKLENIEGARRLGIRGFQFSTVDQLRQDLISSGMDAWLPLPE